ncbi:MAG: TadE family protein [Actinomycetes bacterium]
MRTLTQVRPSSAGSLRRGRRGRPGRAATMIEFALVLPIFLFLMLLTVDMGLLMLTSGAMNDTAFSAARAGAEAGGAGLEHGALACPVDGHCQSGISYDTAEEGLAQMPLGPSSYAYDHSTFTVESGALCTAGGPDTFVTVKMHYRVHTFTPGLSALLGINGDSDWPLTATGVARCETYRTN